MSQPTPAASTAITTPAPTQDTPLQKLGRFLNSKTAQLAKYAGKQVDPTSMIRIAMFHAGQDSKLAACDPGTFYVALLVCAQLGLEPSGLNGEAYLIPFKDNESKTTIVQVVPGYRGLIKLALRSGKVKDISAYVVRAGDEFTVWLGTRNEVIHQPTMAEAGEERPIIAAYAVATLTDGSKKFEVIDAYDIRKIRDFATKRGESPAYRDWPEQMAKKAAIRRICKTLNLGPDHARVEMVDTLNDQAQATTTAAQAIGIAASDVIEAEVVEHPPSKIASLVAKAGDK